MSKGWFYRDLIAAKERKARLLREHYEQIDSNVFRLLGIDGPTVQQQCLECGDIFTHRNRDGFGRCARCRSESACRYSPRTPRN